MIVCNICGQSPCACNASIIPPPVIDHNPWRWYYSQNEETWHGGYATRDEAVEQGRADWSGEAFVVMEAKQSVIKYFEALNLEVYWEDLDEYNEECNGEEDFNCASYMSTFDEKEDLKQRLKRAFDEWIAAHPKVQFGWRFGETRNQEVIPEEATSE